MALSVFRHLKHLFTSVWLLPITDPLQAARALAAYPQYLVQWRQYIRLPGAERMRLADAYPQLHDRSSTMGVDSHYFYVNAWAMRRIVARGPVCHVDIGSQTIFASLLSAVVPVVFLDYRPLRANLAGLGCLQGDILNLPFADASLESLSCLHVAEHIGLGRYGDPLNPDGTRKAVQELARVLARKGNLYFALPVGRPRVCFNAHRIHAPEMICRYFSDLELVEFSGVGDDGRFLEGVALSSFNDSQYACGFFWFRRA